MIEFNPDVTGERHSTVGLSRGYTISDVRQPGEVQAMQSGGLSLEAMMSFMDDINIEPAWRVMADKCTDYYDNNQLDSEVLALMERRGVPPIIINIIQPTINTVLGMQAKNRRDWLVTFGDDGQSEMAAKAINKKIKVAEQSSKADRAVQLAYAAQIKAGLGWVEVGRNSNPFDPPYRVNYVHRREIWWDWREPEEDKWRYLVRKKWYDQDALIQGMPQFENLIRGTCAGWPMDAFMVVGSALHNERTGLADAYDRERAFTVAEHEWRDTARKRCVTYEVWYRKWKTGLVARLPNDQVIEFNEKNPRHMAAFQAGLVNPFPATFPQVRQSLWLGPHRIFDRKSPYPHRHFPYVPFMGYREDLTGIPYGLIRTMISPQDEINARRSRMMALTGARRAEIDTDALDETMNTLQDAADEVSRHDSILFLNPNRKNVNGVKITDNGDLTQQQFAILQESKSEIHQVSGVFPAMAGNDTRPVSGIALAGFVEQGTNTLAEINDEYQDANTRVGELLLSLVVEDSMHPHQVSLGEGKSKTTVYLNRPTGFNELGDVVKENDLSLANLKLELQEVPTSQTYRQQQFAQLAEITKALPPGVQQFVIDFVIEATDHPDRKKMGKRIRSALGIPEDGVDGEGQEDPAVTQVKNQANEQIAVMTQQLEALMAEAEAAKKAAADKAGELEFKRTDSERKDALENRKLELERERMAKEEAIRQADAEAKRAQEEAARDQQFLSSLAADANENGVPDIEEVATLVVDRVTPLIEKWMERSKKETEAIAKSIEQMRADEAKEKAKESSKPAAPVEPPQVIFQPGAITVAPNIVMPSNKPVAKTVTLPDGSKATIEPKADKETE